MEKAKKKSTGFYPTPAPLVRTLMENYFEKYSTLPETLIEPSAGHGDFIMHAWEVAIETFRLNKRQIEKMVETTILFENEKTIFRVLKRNIEIWCAEKGLRAKPELFQENFLLNGRTSLDRKFNDVLVIGNPPWDEFTTRKHDGDVAAEDGRKERLEEKAKFQALGYRNVYQAFLHEILALETKCLGLVFVLPRQLLGDLSAESVRKQLVSTGSMDLSVYCNKDEPEFYFEAVARTAEILCLQYKTSAKKEVKIRRGFAGPFHKIKPYGADFTLPCPFKRGTEKLLSQILENSSLADWADDCEVKISRGKVDYTDRDYASALNGRTMTAYQFEEGPFTDVILNKILPDSRRKLKAAVLRTKDAVSDSMLRVTCKNSAAHPYLMLLLNSRPIELALRSVISNINLNNFRLLSLPIPQPTERAIAKAKLLCRKGLKGTISWEEASDQMARDIYGLSSSEFEPLQELFPDRDIDKIAA
jgi:hypothetical protein